MQTNENSHSEIPCDGFDLNAITLSRGAHGYQFQGVACAIEWANRAAVMCPTLRAKYGAPDRFCDNHPTISPIVRRLIIGLNDSFNDDDRQQLRPYVVRVLGTRTNDADEVTRSRIAFDAYVRKFIPAALRAAGQSVLAEQVEALPPLTSREARNAATPTLGKVLAEVLAEVQGIVARRDRCRFSERGFRDRSGLSALREFADGAYEDGEGRYTLPDDLAVHAMWLAASNVLTAARAVTKDDANATLLTLARSLQPICFAALDAMIAVGKSPEFQAGPVALTLHKDEAAGRPSIMPL